MIRTPHYKDASEIVVRRPTAGLVDVGNPTVLPNEAATEANNVCFDSGGVEKSQGRVILGDRITDTSPTTCANCHAGWQYGEKDGTKTMYRVNGPYLYRLQTATGSPLVHNTDPSTWTWVGAVSGLADATEADIIGSGVNLGTFIQWAHRIHYADGGELRSMFDPDDDEIGPWGNPFGTLPAPVIRGDSGGGNLLNSRKYSIRYTLYDPSTGRETSMSEESNIYTTAVTAPADKSSLDIMINAIEEWTEEWSTIRIYRSPGSLANPTQWFLDSEYENIRRLDKWEHLFWLYKLDGDLDQSTPAPDDHQMIPKARYVLVSPSGKFVVAFGDPDNPNTYYWSKDGNPWQFPTANQEDVASDDGDELRGGFVLNQRLYLLKRNRGIYMLVEDSLGGFSQARITDDFGTVSHHSIVVAHGTRAFWLSTKGAVEFIGNSPKLISNNIRELYERLVTSGAFEDAYGIHDRQADKQYIRWLVRDPDDGLTHHLIYDLTTNAWTYSLPGDAAQDASGVRDRCAWLGEDADGQFVVYTGDTTGRCFRHRYGISASVNADGDLEIVSSGDLYDANGYDYEMTFSTPEFGDGISTFFPTEILWEWEAAENALTQGVGNVTVNVYRDGEASPVDSQTFAIPTGAKTSYAERMRTKAGVCRRLRVEWVHSVKNGRPKLYHYKIVFMPEAKHREIGA